MSRGANFQIQHQSKEKEIEASLSSNSHASIAWTPIEEKRLVRKIDLALMPAIWLMNLLSHLDRINIGNAKIAGMADDLHLSSNDYSTAVVVFFVGYVVFEAPSNVILIRTRRPSRYLPTIMTIWGVLTCCMAAIKSYSHLLILRIFVGVLERGFTPGVVLLISLWYRKTEQSMRVAILASAAVLSGAFGGLLAGSITDGLECVRGIRGWRWLFLVEGIVTVGLAVIIGFILPDFPSSNTNTKKLCDHEKQIAIVRLQSQQNVSVYVQQSNSNHHHHHHHLSTTCQSVLTALKDWRLYPFSIGFMVIFSSFSLSYFYPTLVKGLGYDNNQAQAQYMTVPIWVVAFLCEMAMGYLADKAPHWRGIITAGLLLVALGSSIVVCIVADDFKLRYAMLVLMASGLWSADAVSISYASSTLGNMDEEARAVALALANAMGNLAQLGGPYLFPTRDAPGYLMGFGILSGLLGLGVCVYSGLNVVLRKGKLQVGV